jgi:hypothetical protein
MWICITQRRKDAKGGVAEWEYELKFFRKINNDPLRLCAFACNKKILIHTLILQRPKGHRVINWCNLRFTKINKQAEFPGLLL